MDRIIMREYRMDPAKIKKEAKQVILEIVKEVDDFYNILDDYEDDYAFTEAFDPNVEMKQHLLNLISDIEKMQRRIGCYPYPKTIRSILSASEFSPIAPHFSDKEYYGVLQERKSLLWITQLLEELIDEGYLRVEFYKEKKRYYIKNGNTNYVSTNPINVNNWFDNDTSEDLDEHQDFEDVQDSDDLASIFGDLGDFDF